MAENTIRLLNAMTDSELDDAIQKLDLVKEYLENFEEQEKKIATSVYGAITIRPEGARSLARLLIATNVVMYPGAKKILRLSRKNLHVFALDFQTRKTPIAQLVWDLRLAHNI